MISKLTQLSQTKTNLIFDFDKTIAQLEIDWSDWHTGVAEIYSKYEKNHGYSQGEDPHQYYNALVDRHGENLVDDVRKFVSMYEKKRVFEFTPYVELVNFIKKVHSNSSDSSIKMFVFSSNARNTIETGLKKLQIFEAFSQLVTRDDVFKVKPDPEGFHLFDQFDQQKNTFLLIGDSNADRSAAKQAGISFLQCSHFETYVFSNE